MTVLSFTLWVFAGSLLAGLVGAVTGLGGGVVLVPLLTLGFGVEIHYAMGASLISVMATSSGAAAAFVREGFTNLRIGMFLETGTVVGATAGAVIASLTKANDIALIFGLVLLPSAWMSWRRREERERQAPASRLASRLRLSGFYPERNAQKAYSGSHVFGGWAVMLLAGTLSGLLGIGSGAVKVLAMDDVMRLPYKVSTATSNFIIGITAAASAGIYLVRGYVDPGLTMPVMLGVLCGAVLGARLLVRIPVRKLRLGFAVVIALLGLEMIVKGFAGRL